MPRSNPDILLFPDTEAILKCRVFSLDNRTRKTGACVLQCHSILDTRNEKENSPKIIKEFFILLRKSVTYTEVCLYIQLQLIKF